MNIEARVIWNIARQIGRQEKEVLLSSSLLDDLKVDSLDSLEIVMALEEEFEIDIPDSSFESLTTVQQIVDYINSVLN